MNPAKLCHSIKNSFEHLYMGTFLYNILTNFVNFGLIFFKKLAFVKVIRLLDMYSSKQEQLSKDERHGFIKNIKNW